jgi:hypothetical protein
MVVARARLSKLARDASAPPRIGRFDDSLNP